MAYRTLAELESDIRYRFDIEGFTARHPQANLFRLINDAVRTLRERLTSDGSRLFVTTTEAAQATTGRTAGYPGTILDGFLLYFTIVFEVHCLIGTSWIPLVHRHMMDALTDTDDSRTGIPQAWCLAGFTEVGHAGTGIIRPAQLEQILIFPPLDFPRTFRVIGLETWTELTASTDRIFSDFGVTEYVYASVGSAIAQRDDDVALFAARRQELEIVYQDLKNRSKQREPAPTRRVDVRSWRLR
jgi:hypothetical protein